MSIDMGLSIVHWISFVMTILEIFTIDTNIRIMISELILVILLVGGVRT